MMKLPDDRFKRKKQKRTDTPPEQRKIMCSFASIHGWGYSIDRKEDNRIAIEHVVTPYDGGYGNNVKVLYSIDELSKCSLESIYHKFSIYQMSPSQESINIESELDSLEAALRVVGVQTKREKAPYVCANHERIVSIERWQYLLARCSDGGLHIRYPIGGDNGGYGTKVDKVLSQGYISGLTVAELYKKICYYHVSPEKNIYLMESEQEALKTALDALGIRTSR